MSAAAVYSQPDEVWFPMDQLEPCQGKIVNGIYAPAPCKGCQCRLELRWPGKEIALDLGRLAAISPDLAQRTIERAWGPPEGAPRPVPEPGVLSEGAAFAIIDNQIR